MLICSLVGWMGQREPTNQCGGEVQGACHPRFRLALDPSRVLSGVPLQGFHAFHSGPILHSIQGSILRSI